MIASVAFAFLLTGLCQSALIGGMAWAAIKLFRVSTPSSQTSIWSIAFFGAAIAPFAIFLPTAVPEIVPFSASMTDTNIAGEILQTNIDATVDQRRVFSLPDAVPQMILFVWLAGSGWRGFNLASDAAAMQKLRRQSRAIAPQSIGLKAAIDIRVHPSVRSPFATGILRPVVILPASMLEHDNANVLRGALAHEFAHVERCDLIANFVEAIVLCIYWWNLPMRLMYGAIAEQRELACDDFAVSKTKSATDYATALLSCAEQAASKRLAASGAAIAIANDKTHLLQRVRRLAAVDYAPNMSTGRTRAVLAAAALSMATACAAAAAPRVLTTSSAYAETPYEQTTVQGNAKRQGRMLVEAVIDSDLPRARTLLAQGADINAVLERDGTPLIAAVNNDAISFAEWLITNGADVNAYALYDETALISAVRNSSPEMVRLLINAGADVNLKAKTETGVFRTPLGEAQKRGRRNIEEILGNAGATQ